jgi:cell division protein ZapA
MTATTSLDIHLLGKSFKVACSAEEEAALRAAADYLDGKMREIRASGKVIGLEKIAIMAGLNIAHELLAQAGTPGAEARVRLQRLNHLLDEVLEEQPPLF